MSLTRRDFVQQSLAAGVAVAGGPLVARAGAASAPPPGRRLVVHAWPATFAPNLLRAFEREHGIAVSVVTHEHSDTMLDALAGGPVPCDVAVLTGHALATAIAAGLVRPIDRARLAHAAAVTPVQLGRAYDPGHRHAVPFQWGTTGLAWRSDLAPAPAGWGALLAPRWRGRTALLAERRDVLGALLRRRGASVNSTAPAPLAAALADARLARAQARALGARGGVAGLLDGSVVLAQLWDADARRAARRDPRIRFAVPAEGGVVWLDALAIGGRSAEPEAAHAFLDFTLRPDVALRLAEWSGAGSLHAAAARLDVPFPPPAAFARLEYEAPLGAADAACRRAWLALAA